MSIQSTWDGASAEVKAKYLAFNGETEFDLGEVFREAAEFADIIKAMAAPFYCEQADEYNLNAVSGVETEEKALDLLVDGADKYGDWSVFRWAVNKWQQAKIKRKGKNVELVWTDYEY